MFSRTRETGRFSKLGKRGTSVQSFGVIRDGPEARVGFDRAALKRKTESGEKSSKSDRKRSQPASNLKLTSHFIGRGYSAAVERKSAWPRNRDAVGLIPAGCWAFFSFIS